MEGKGWLEWVTEGFVEQPLASPGFAKYSYSFTFSAVSNFNLKASPFVGPNYYFSGSGSDDMKQAQFGDFQQSQNNFIY